MTEDTSQYFNFNKIVIQLLNHQWFVSFFTTERSHTYTYTNADISCYNWLIVLLYDDVIKWKHFPRYWPFVTGALMFSLISAWTNGWANTRDAGDYRRHRSNYDVTVIWRVLASWWPGDARNQGITNHVIASVFWNILVSVPGIVKTFYCSNCTISFSVNTNLARKVMWC